MKREFRIYEKGRCLVGGSPQGGGFGILGGFFDIERESGEDFKRLAISEKKRLCAEWMNSFLSDSLKVNPLDKESFRKLADKTADKADTCNALYLLTCMMCSHYGRQVILFIDEYDVPLAKASDYGYYDKMLDIIRALFDKIPFWGCGYLLSMGCAEPCGSTSAKSCKEAPKLLGKHQP